VLCEGGRKKKSEMEKEGEREREGQKGREGVCVRERERVCVCMRE
jgi:hypothetical protein